MLAPVIKFGAAMLGRARNTGRSVEDSSVAEYLRSLRYDPPRVSLWSMLKTAVIAIPLLLLALWIGKWWFRESILKEFRAESARQEQIQLAKDRATIRQLEAQIETERENSAKLLEVQAAEFADATMRLQAIQAALRTAGKCGWDDATMAIIQGRPTPKPKILRVNKDPRK